MDNAFVGAERYDEIHHVERRLGRQSDTHRSSSCELVKPTPNVRRKKVDRREHPRPFLGPCGSFALGGELRLLVSPPLSSDVSIAPAGPSNVPPLLRIFDDPHDVSRATSSAHPSLQRSAPKPHRELRPSRVRRASRLIAHGGRVAPARRELRGVAITIASDDDRVAWAAVPAAGSCGPAARLRAADPAQRKRLWELDFLEVVELVEGPERHGSCVRAASGGVLSHTLTSCACLRKFPSQAREPQ